MSLKNQIPRCSRLFLYEPERNLQFLIVFERKPKPNLPNGVGTRNCGRGAGHVQIPEHGGKAEGVEVIVVGKTETCHG